MSWYWWIILALSVYFILALFSSLLRQTSRNHTEQWTYRSEKDRFELILPSGWQENKLFNRVNAEAHRYEFYGPDGKITLTIGPLYPEPPLRKHQDNIRLMAERQGHQVLEIHEIEVQGKNHAAMTCKVPALSVFNLYLKNYFLIFDGIEYVITVSLRGNQVFFDEIVKTFRPISRQTQTNKQVKGVIEGFANKSVNPQEQWENIFTNPIKEGVIAGTKDPKDGKKKFRAFLEKLPPSNECTGQKAQQKFMALLQLANIYRKWTPDAEKELDILTECMEILDRQKLPEPLPGPEHVVNFEYIAILNEM